MMGWPPKPRAHQPHAETGTDAATLTVPGDLPQLCRRSRSSSSRESKQPRGTEGLMLPGARNLTHPRAKLEQQL